MDGVFLCSDDASLKTRLTNSLERYGEKLNIAFHSRALRRGMNKQFPSRILTPVVPTMVSLDMKPCLCMLLLLVHVGHL